MVEGSIALQVLAAAKGDPVVLPDRTSEQGKEQHQRRDTESKEPVQAAAGGGDAAMGVLMAGQQAAMGKYLAYSRVQESAADAAGAQFLAKPLEIWPSWVRIDQRRQRR